MTFAQFVVQVIVALAPTFWVLMVMFLVMSWIRLLVDSMSGRGI